MATHVLGIRHHGPGSARALVAALDALAADCVLIEGPPDADEVIALAAHPDLRPPVALLVYAADAPARAAFYPFAEFSPEWQAMRWAVTRGVPVRFMDLPQAHQLDPAGYATGDRDLPRDPVADDPLGALAEAAGYDDRELWWELVVEQRRDPSGVFDGVLEAMTALREGRPLLDPREQRREAFMRRTIRAAEREGHQQIAVVCGAWHGPALVAAARPPVKDDDALLRGLPKTKVTATWVPWSRARLATRSGYGAGVRSPGWYAHLWASRDRVAERWLTEVARLLRSEGLDAPPASVIEAVRLADALAALRDRAMPGLEELHEATRAVLAHGEAARLALIRDRLEVGRGLGQVPADAPMVPLARDLAASQKRLRLKPSAEAKTIDLDLRSETDRARSVLLHRLGLLGIAWGAAQDVRGSAGTFKERWTLRWDPELAVAVVEASVHGNTVEVAAAHLAIDQAARADDLAKLTELLDRVVLAELPEAVRAALAQVSAVAALAGDAKTLMAALPPLARAARWGDVRGTPATLLLPVIDALFARALIGLSGACASLDDEAAAAVRALLGQTTEALRLLDRAEPLEAWYAELAALVARDGVHGLVRGGSARLLIEAGRIDEVELGRLARLALSVAAPPAQAAAWAEGVLGTGATMHLAHDALWVALDRWLAGLGESAFVELLPLVRRAFSALGGPERRRLADRVRALGAAGGTATDTRRRGGPLIDEARARRVAPIVRLIVGLAPEEAR